MAVSVPVYSSDMIGGKTTICQGWQAFRRLSDPVRVRGLSNNLVTLSSQTKDSAWQKALGAQL